MIGATGIAESPALSRSSGLSSLVLTLGCVVNERQANNAVSVVHTCSIMRGGGFRFAFPRPEKKSGSSAGNPDCSPSIGTTGADCGASIHSSRLRVVSVATERGSSFEDEEEA